MSKKKSKDAEGYICLLSYCQRLDLCLLAEDQGLFGGKGCRVVLEVLVAEVGLLVADCQLAFEVWKELVDHEVQAFQDGAFDCHAFGGLDVFWLLGILVQHVIAGYFLGIIAVLLLQLYFQQECALLTLDAVSLDPQREVLLRLSDQLERLLRIIWFLAAAFWTDIQLIFFSFKQAQHELSIQNGFVLHNISLKIQDTQFESLPRDLTSHVNVIVIFSGNCECNNNEVIPETGKRKVSYWKFHLIYNENGLEVMHQVLVAFYVFALAQGADLTGFSFLFDAVHMHGLLAFWLQLGQGSKDFVHANELDTLSDRVLLAWIRKEPMQGQRKVGMFSLEQPHQKQPANVDKLFAFLASYNHQRNLFFLQRFLRQMSLFILPSLEMPRIEVIRPSFRPLNFKQPICQVLRIQILNQLPEPLRYIFGFLLIKAIRDMYASKPLQKRSVKFSSLPDMHSFHKRILSFKADSGQQVDMVANVPHKLLILRWGICLKDAEHLGKLVVA